MLANINIIFINKTDDNEISKSKSIKMCALHVFTIFYKPSSPCRLRRFNTNL